VALCSLTVIGQQRAAVSAAPALETPVARLSRGGPDDWFAAIRPRCNAVEVALAMTRTPPPPGNEGAAFAPVTTRWRASWTRHGG
jgi:hypothetical protein